MKLKKIKLKLCIIMLCITIASGSTIETYREPRCKNNNILIACVIKPFLLALHIVRYSWRYIG